MAEQKFQKKQEIVLYNIARALKLVSVEEIIKLTGNSLTEKQVITALISLQRRKLVIKSLDKKFGINFSQIIRIKKIIGTHWESNWEDIWKNVK